MENQIETTLVIVYWGYINLGSEFRVQGLGLRVLRVLRIWDLWFRVEGLRFRIWIRGLRV